MTEGSVSDGRRAPGQSWGPGHGGMDQARQKAAATLRRNWDVAAAARVSAAETVARAIQSVSEDMVEFATNPSVALERHQKSQTKMIDDLLRANQKVTHDLLGSTHPTAFTALQQQFARSFMEALTEGSQVVLRALAQANDDNAAGLEQQVAQQRRALEQQPRGRILIVDDDPDVARVAGAFLRRAGFNVTTVTGADEALAQLGGTVPFDALISDHAMPGMKGSDLILQARELRQDLPALIITGYTGAEGLHSLPSDVTILRKPFQREELVSKVRAMIDDRAGTRGPGRTAAQSA